MMVDSAGTWVVGVGIIPPVAVCQGEDPELIPGHHNTTVIIRSPTPAPVLVLLTFYFYYFFKCYDLGNAFA